MSSFRKLKRLSYRSLLVCLFLIVALPSAECSFRLCGFKLTMTLQALCKNKLCGGFAVNTLAGQNSPEEVEIDGDERNAVFLFTPSYQKRSGIATECCEKRCSLKYLKTFCCAGFSNNNTPPPKRSSLYPAEFQPQSTMEDGQSSRNINYGFT